MSEFTYDLEKELQKIVSMTEIIYATEEYTVNWEDILSELETYFERAYVSADTARFTTEIVYMIKERADYIERFLALASTNEAAEYLTLYALCKVGTMFQGEDLEPFIRAALDAASSSVNI